MMHYIPLLVCTLVLTTHVTTTFGCEMSEFGCCKDGVTPALDNDLGGCPEVKLCNMPAVSGICTQALRRWYYNSLSQTCEQLVYSGCGGNANRFDSRGECWQACASQGAVIQGAKVAEEGQNLVLTCPITEGFEYVSWTLYQPHATYSIDEGELAGAQVRGYGSSQDLVIYNMQRDMAGVYTCKLREISNLQVSSLDIQVIVKDSDHSFTLAGMSTGVAAQTDAEAASGSSETVTVGSNVTLTCNIPAGNRFVVWELENLRGKLVLAYGTYANVQMSTSGSKAMLFITSIQLNQAGVYVCQIQDLSSLSLADVRLDLSVSEGTKELYKYIPTSTTEGGPNAGGPSICYQSVHTSLCSSYSAQWYYDSSEGDCLQFWYGGCPDIENVFSTQQDCLETCESVAAVSTTTMATTETPTCSLPADRGPCKGIFYQYAYDSRTKSCTQFVYGGCEGNSNRFNSQSECEERCMPTESQTDVDVCTLAKASGDCTGRFIKWYYDAERKFCGRFYYTGCGGNENRFDDRQSCRLACVPGVTATTTMRALPTTSTLATTSSTGDVCSLNKATGTCSDFKIFWFYDQQVKMCKRFYYSGCGGNGNRFPDRFTCMAVCVGGVSTTLPLTTTPRPTSYVKEAQIINHSETQYRVVSGDDVKLRCRSTGVPQPTHSWYKQRKPLQTEGNPKYSYDPQTGDLYIRKVDLTDSAEFICKAYNGVGRGDFLYINLVVTSPVVIQDNISRVEVYSGDSTFLKCNAIGTPLPTITWMFKGSVLSVHPADNPSLYIPDVDELDEGNYTCLADNGLTSDEKVVSLVLMGPIVAELAEHETSYVEGDSLTLTCMTNYPKATITWTIVDDRRVKSRNGQQTGGTLTLTSLDQSDSGYYSCSANYKQESATVSTRITVEPRVILPPAPKPCGERPELANCELIVYYGFCNHSVYKIYCCKSCLEAGQFSPTTTGTVSR